jgi:cell division initiation protein
MITPLDIQNKEFAKSVNGYKKDDVDEFLDLLTVDMEKVLSENAALKAENARLSTDLQKYKGSEGAVLETLEAAKALMGDISASAEKRAEILLKNAELDAEIITREARESVERLNEESVLLKNRFTVFQSKYRNLLEMELERFDTLSAEIFAEFGIEEQAEEVKVKVKDFSQTMVNIRKGDGA